MQGYRRLFHDGARKGEGKAHTSETADFKAENSSLFFAEFFLDGNSLQEHDLTIRFS